MEEKPLVQRVSPVRKLAPGALNGKLFPWNAEAREPMFLRLGDRPVCWLMIFSDESPLHGMMKHFNVSGYTVEKLGAGFLDRIPSVVAGLALKVVIDPRLMPDGKLEGTHLVGRD